ncbi:sentrin-specific protease 5-like isoform X2 [Scleropages formosus]|uniref:sentrin-specific protease 5-like isoform X2 n=1 Tax=Scleropages formosus TaxID=113540 RepID=UPI000878FBBE|nr:sentrin-specific protease 5-like isoform X2 [Scleropages formosus]
MPFRFSRSVRAFVQGVPFEGSSLYIQSLKEPQGHLAENAVTSCSSKSADQRKKLTGRGTAEVLQATKRLRLTAYKEVRTLCLLMRFSFRFQYRCRARKSRLGSHRKAKHLYRISTLRGKRLRTEVIRYLSNLSAELKGLTREVNADHLLKLKAKSLTVRGRDGVGPAEMTMVQDGHVSNVPVGGHGRTSGRKRTPKSCDCCGHSCGSLSDKAPSSEKPERRGRKKRTLETMEETPLETTKETPLETQSANSPQDAQLNGTVSPEGETGTDMEIEQPAPDLISLNPLRDHRYCKTEDGHADSEMEDSMSTNPLTVEGSDEQIQDLIHDFLEYFYGKYGSFIALSDSDVLEHLNNKLNTDLSDRKLFVCAEVTKYRSGLASAPMHYFKVTYNKHTLTLDDLSTLENQNWVNDQVINMYGELIMDAVNHKVHFFNSFFHRQLVAKGYEGVKRWTKKVDLFTKTLLLIPIHLEIHWSLITVDIGKQHINFYDSQGIVFKHAVDNILRYILAEAKEKKQAMYQKGWKTIVNKSIPQQKNDSDCGVFVLEYCKCLALKEPLQFTQEDMPKVRKRIYKELCECKLQA